MAYERKDNTASLFPNKYKRDSKDPDYKGEAMIDGVMKAVAAWENESKSGKYLNIKFFEHKHKQSKPDDLQW